MSTQVEPERAAAPADAAPPGDAPAPPETVIGPPRGWQLIDLGELWRFGLLLGLMAWYGVWSWQILLVPAVFAILVVAAVAVGTLLAGLYVSYRDFRYVTPFLVQVWMFATPSIYMAASAAGEGNGWVQL